MLRSRPSREGRVAPALALIDALDAAPEGRVAALVGVTVAVVGAAGHALEVVVAGLSVGTVGVLHTLLAAVLYAHRLRCRAVAVHGALAATELCGTDGLVGRAVVGAGALHARLQHRILWPACSQH